MAPVSMHKKPARRNFMAGNKQQIIANGHIIVAARGKTWIKRRRNCRLIEFCQIFWPARSSETCFCFVKNPFVSGWPSARCRTACPWAFADRWTGLWLILSPKSWWLPGRYSPLRDGSIVEWSSSVVRQFATGCFSSKSMMSSCLWL